MGQFYFPKEITNINTVTSKSIALMPVHLSLLLKDFLKVMKSQKNLFNEQDQACHKENEIDIHLRSLLKSNFKCPMVIKMQRFSIEDIHFSPNGYRT